MDEELTILTNPADGNGPAAVISIGVPTGAAHHVIASTTSSAAVLISIGVPTGAAHHVIASTTTKNSNETKSQRRNKW
jgi:hypothetical protein